MKIFCVKIEKKVEKVRERRDQNRKKVELKFDKDFKNTIFKDIGNRDGIKITRMIIDNHKILR